LKHNLTSSGPEAGHGSPAYLRGIETNGTLIRLEEKVEVSSLPKRN